MKKSTLLIPVLAVVFMFVCSAGLRAAITVDSNFTGTLVLTSPEGDIDLIDAGDDIPSISNNSLIEVFDGNMSMATQVGDSAEASCLGYSIGVNNGGSISLKCQEDGGVLTAVIGPVVVTDDAGNVVELQSGESFDLVLSGLEEAAPTAAREDRRGRGNGGNDDDDGDDADDNDDDQGEDDDDQGEDDDNQDDDSSPK